MSDDTQMVDQIRQVMREELDLALGPIASAIARMGQPHEAEHHNADAHDAGVKAARKRILDTQRQARGEKVEAEPTPDPPDEPKARVRRFVAPVCDDCGGDMISTDDGPRCPRCR